ncbi:hypothetical protein GCM10027406_13890 [Leifsonia lichenia]
MYPDRIESLVHGLVTVATSGPQQIQYGRVMRLLTDGWCARGPSLAEAAAELAPPSTLWWESEEFRDAPSDDLRAALNTWILTGHVPHRRDVKGAGDGLVDLVLCPTNAPKEPLEILATIDWSYQAAVPRAEALVAELNGSDPPELYFAIHMERGWQPPKTKGRKAREAGDRWRAAVERVRGEARAGAISDDAAEAIQEVFPGLEFRPPIYAQGKSGFALESWNAAVSDSGEIPYLERLSTFLATAERPVHHLAKLEREAVELGAQRQHLYLLMASTGRWGNLAPTSPSWFTEGIFTAPDGLTDLWLDGGTGYIIRWRQERGWTYHEQD